MGLESLLIFTLLGGMAAGAYGFETILMRKRQGDKPWFLTLVVVVLFSIGCLASATHINDFGRAFASVFVNGTVNLNAAMVHEVFLAGIFLVLAIIDLAITAAKKTTPFALRAITAVLGVIVIVAMGLAYIDSYANPIWCEAPATVIGMLGGSLAAGFTLYALLTSADYDESNNRKCFYIAAAIFALGILMEIGAFVAHGASVLALVIALIVGPIASVAVVLNSSKISKKTTLVSIVFALVLIGFIICRWAFYASMGM